MCAYGDGRYARRRRNGVAPGKNRDAACRSAAHSAQTINPRIGTTVSEPGNTSCPREAGEAPRRSTATPLSTARVNGTGGTDHGTGTVVFVAGGAIAGGRVQADWPGLGANRLFENRDLQPTVDVRAVAKGVLAQHLGLDAAGLAKVFPDSQSASSMRGLVRA